MVAFCQKKCDFFDYFTLMRYICNKITIHFSLLTINFD